MQIKLPTLLTLATLSIPAVYAGVVGRDDRQEVSESRHSVTQTIAASTAAKVPREFIRRDRIVAPSLQERIGLCSDERFALQPSAADCTGFLVAPDLLLTAGHCIKTLDDCAEFRWVFGLTREQVSEKLSPDQIYSCTEIVSRAFYNDNTDYALVRLDRPAKQKPLAYRQSGVIEVGAHVATIGHPSGLPLKLASNATVSAVRPVHVDTDLDVFGGNSGGPVFDTNTGLVEGILIQADETEYEKDESAGCARVKPCTEHCVTSKFLKLDQVLGLPGVERPALFTAPQGATQSLLGRWTFGQDLISVEFSEHQGELIANVKGFALFKKRDAVSRVQFRSDGIIAASGNASLNESTFQVFLKLTPEGTLRYSLDLEKIDTGIVLNKN